MALEPEGNLRLEIGHVLFVDIVGYSKLLIEEQKERSRQLTEIVLATPQVAAASNEQLIRLPTGDGMALVFRSSPEEAAQCALEIARAIKIGSEVPVRMGIHSGPVSEVTDLNGHINIAGAGINMAQRVMDCGDAGHILLSERVADDLAQYRQWSPNLHDLGDCEVKHGVRLHLVNLYTSELGNPAVPEKVQAARGKDEIAPGSSSRSKSRPIMLGIVLLALGGLAALAIIFVPGLLRISGRHSSWALVSPTPSAALSVQPLVIPEKSIAVLPFDSLSSEKDNAYFAGGIQDEILTDLAKVADLRVISRGSVIKYNHSSALDLPAIALALKVGNVLVGSVQRAGNKIRVSVQLIDAQSATQLWAQRYDRDLTDIFAIQTEIAEKVVTQLKAVLSPSERVSLSQRPTENLRAYDDYLRGKELFFTINLLTDPSSDEKYERAQGFLRDAVKQDPQFALAYSLLAQVSLDRYFFTNTHPRAILDEAKAALTQAERLAPDAPETHFAQGYYYYYGSGEYEKALAAMELAGQSLPNNANIFNVRARIERRMERWDDASVHFQRAVILDPRNLQGLEEAVSFFTDFRDYPRAFKLADQGLAEFPGSVPLLIRKVEAAYDSGDVALCRATLDKIAPKERMSSVLFWDRMRCALAERDFSAARLLATTHRDLGSDELEPPDSFFLGLVARIEGDAASANAYFREARPILEETIRLYPANYDALALRGILGLTYAALGLRDEALGIAALEVETAKGLDRRAALLDQARVQVWVGEDAQALAELKEQARLPHGVSYGELRFDPAWDLLRDDPRFQKLVEELAPKQG